MQTKLTAAGPVKQKSTQNVGLEEQVLENLHTVLLIALMTMVGKRVFSLEFVPVCRGLRFLCISLHV